ncbi:hypothetical protein SANTM175S_09876 [Streptomyces antimycoticus]
MSGWASSATRSTLGHALALAGATYGGIADRLRARSCAIGVQRADGEALVKGAMDTVIERGRTGCWWSEDVCTG